MDIKQIRQRIMCEAYDLADRGDHEGYNSVKVMCSDVLALIKALETQRLAQPDYEAPSKAMNREDIIRMAREAGFTEGDLAVFPDLIVHFATLVAEHERESCAKVCDVLAVHPEYASDITKLAAQAIRTRGNT